MVYKFLEKKAPGRTVKHENISNKDLAEELHKPIIRTFKKRKVHSPFINNVWGADLADIQLINKFNKGIRFWLFIIDICSKYAWVIYLKDKKGITITNAFQRILKELNRKPSKIWIVKVSEFYNTSMKSCLEKGAVEIH